MDKITSAISNYTLLYAAGLGLAALLSACSTLGPGHIGYDPTETETETGFDHLELPLPGEQWGPCLDDEPRCYSIGECTEDFPGLTMCSAPADVCPPASIADVELPAVAVFDGTGKCVVMCESDDDCYPEVGFVCGGDVCGWSL